jgi:hypothetical protein
VTRTAGPPKTLAWSDIEESTELPKNRQRLARTIPPELTNRPLVADESAMVALLTTSQSSSSTSAWNTWTPGSPRTRSPDSTTGPVVLLIIRPTPPNAPTIRVKDAPSPRRVSSLLDRNTPV